MLGWTAQQCLGIVQFHVWWAQSERCKKSISCRRWETSFFYSFSHPLTLLQGGLKWTLHPLGRKDFTAAFNNKCKICMDHLPRSIKLTALLHDKDSIFEKGEWKTIRWKRLSSDSGSINHLCTGWSLSASINCSISWYNVLLRPLIRLEEAMNCPLRMPTKPSRGQCFPVIMA